MCPIITLAKVADAVANIADAGLGSTPNISIEIAIEGSNIIKANDAFT